MKEWKDKAFEGAVVLLVVAVVSRIGWTLLQPILPLLIIFVVMSIVYRIIFRDKEH
jgi:hypothetical protein